jgi:hypothetical protein
MHWCLRRGQPGLLQTSVKGRANVDVPYRSRYRFWLLLVVRYVKKTNENEYAGSIGIRSEREQSLSSPTPTRTMPNPPRNCEARRKEGRKAITNTDFFPLHQATTSPPSAAATCSTPSWRTRGPRLLVRSRGREEDRRGRRSRRRRIGGRTEEVKAGNEEAV